jgi:hypothetical protein
MYQCSPSLVRDINLGRPEYEAGVLPQSIQLSVERDKMVCLRLACFLSMETKERDTPESEYVNSESSVLPLSACQSRRAQSFCVTCGTQISRSGHISCAVTVEGSPVTDPLRPLLEWTKH